MKKEYLEILHKVLNNTDLGLADARIRDSFLRELEKRLQVFYEDRKKIVEIFCDKDAEGNPVVQDNTYTFTDLPQEKLSELDLELVTLANETVNIELTAKIKEFIENSNYSPKVGEAERIDEILTLAN